MRLSLLSRFMSGVVLVVSSISWADTVVAPREPIGGGGAQDLLNNTSYNPNAPSREKQTGIKMSVSCVDGTGKSLDVKDPGYNECLGHAQQSTNSKVPVGAGPGSANVNMSGF